ncbi:MAG: J domain-containing protein [Actinomycetota bacterium]|nr:J domain-containing protein [Actinomycetota bacterium]
MRSGHTYYEILGVARDAGADEIKKAHRRLMRTCHPDLGGSPALFDLVNEAFAALSDPEQRAPGDAGPDGQPAAPARPASPGSDGYASLRRSRSSIWQPQPGTTYTPEPAPRPRPVTLFI